MARQRNGRMARFLLGVDYWPRSSAMAMWSRFDLGEIDEDFARMAALGLDVVRFFLLWEAFAPSAGSVDALALKRFVDVLDRAHAHGLRTMPTLFCGHMSGVNWLPAWTLDPATPSGRFRTIAGGQVSPYGIGDFYTGALLEAQRTLVRAVGERAREHASILAWDLGNEFSNLRAPRTSQDAAHWSAALTNDLFETSNLGVTGGTHGEDLSEDRNIRLSSLAEPWAFATMHGYPAYSAFARGMDDPDVVPFLHELATGFSRKPVLFSEFGTPASALDDHAAAGYAREVLARLQQRGALGAFWWCWTDYSPSLAATPPFDLAPHELRFGIVRADGTERPVAAALAAFARERRNVVETPALALDEETYYAGLPGSLREAYTAYCARYHREGASG
jgi:endo-1,4-beta-mannosidase